jgi:hypothetical protein
MIAAAIYILCALTAAGCAALLLRGYRASRAPLLLWCSVCFIGLTLNNVALVADRLIVTDVDLWALRVAPAIVGVCALLYGLIWRSE